jgi:hypothetical protein
MRAKLRPGMSRDEFFAVLDEIVMERGLSIGLPSADERVISLPVLEGGELLCFIPKGVLTYVEYKGGIFLEIEAPA